ncbi:TetR/AcrR family transcriptional regulator [Histidinibacterium aquaticum]|uniref:TetR/AcrR family transcriptional regulator n=1 Tax=Histidinibacterium aquaticum TaxID=2613962 RepID=A0A5J5GK07_9RHOB|nr:TetR/AcrR family transcriptional regulator [Histidinibacterium aquaticum]KAA9007993.1 TetR/AcrR family transcriptional regulator [Histidinibacterium aquaticum]
MPKEKKYHHGDLKPALVEAGIAILEEEGLDRLSLRAIAGRVGVSHTAPRNHFANLRALLTAIGTEGFRRHAAAMREGLTETSPGPERLQAATEGYIRFARRHPALFELMFSKHYCDFDDPDLLAAARRSYAVLEEISRGLDWPGAEGPDRQLRTETMLWSLVHGYALLALNGQIREGEERGRMPWITEVVPRFRYEEA